jgi:hypothetical protein
MAFLESTMTWTDLISLIALGMSFIVLGISIFFSRKSLNMSNYALNISKLQFKEFGYNYVINIVNKSENGYDVFPKLNEFFDSYQGVWIDKKIKKYVNNKAEEIKDFEYNSVFSLYTPEYEIEEPEFTEEERNKVLMEQAEEIESMDQVTRYNYEFDEKFKNVKDELLRIFHNGLKGTTKKIN